jgi:hypothetical protein
MEAAPTAAHRSFREMMKHYTRFSASIMHSFFRRHPCRAVILDNEESGPYLPDQPMALTRGQRSFTRY